MISRVSSFLTWSLIAIGPVCFSCQGSATNQDDLTAAAQQYVQYLVARYDTLGNKTLADSMPERIVRFDSLWQQLALEPDSAVGFVDMVITGLEKKVDEAGDEEANQR